MANSIYTDKGIDCVCQKWDAGSPWRTPGFHHLMCRVSALKRSGAPASEALRQVIGLTPERALDQMGMGPS